MHCVAVAIQALQLLTFSAAATSRYRCISGRQSFLGFLFFSLLPFSLMLSTTKAFVRRKRRRRWTSCLVPCTLVLAGPVTWPTVFRFQSGDALLCGCFAVALLRCARMISAPLRAGPAGSAGLALAWPAATSQASPAKQRRDNNSATSEATQADLSTLPRMICSLPWSLLFDGLPFLPSRPQLAGECANASAAKKRWLIHSLHFSPQRPPQSARELLHPMQDMRTAGQNNCLERIRFDSFRRSGPGERRSERLNIELPHCGYIPVASSEA